ncbi:hypothetical protein OIDMADRAFT_57041 [Oidiodendron maius Zn]|uniref:Uncharacterized protein n=1 Tax=Oidiodendron maius (strain Zn) TaxID=913774 RepID=A0A0C3GRN5_OIDMZ|nr:hypothetical protein OIDMADRAFT_57041 [Oidiodendron maius Zn]
MSSPVSFGDIVRALELIDWIRTTCIDPDNNAQVKYLEFKREIEGFENRLIEFRDALRLAIAQVDGQASRLLDAVPRHEVLKQEADTLIGDFVSTLTDCQTLLRAHAVFDSRRGTILDNLFWHTSTQAQVEDLRRRIQAHADKISLFVEPVRLQLATDTAAQTHDILEILMEHVGLSRRIELPNIPSSLDEKFRDALSRHNTIQIVHPYRIPLEEGIDIMTLHYRKSTAVSNGSVTDQTVEQYLHLLKAHWLVEILLKSDSLKKTRPGHLYRRIIKQVRESIAEQYEREEISRYTEDELCALNMSDFYIWPPKVVVPEPPLTEPAGREEMLVRLPMASSPSNETREIFVFRADDRNLRIVYQRSSNDQNQGIRETETFFDLQSDRLIPLYAIATGPRTEWSMQVFYGNGRSQADYPLQTRSDAFKFQQAFIRYETTAYSKDVSCTVTQKKIWPSRDGQHVFDGEIQLLQWPIPNPPPSSPRSPPPNGTMSSMRIQSSFSRASWSFSDANPSLTTVSEAESGKVVVVTALPPPPLIIAFTQDAGTYAFWQIELDRIEIETCHPKALILGFRAKKNGDPFPAHIFRVKKSELASWDLCTLFSDRKVSSNNKKSKDQPKVKTLECTHLALEFSNDKAKEEFEFNLLSVKTLWQKQLKDVGCARSVAEREAQTPRLAVSTRGYSSVND